MNVVFFGFKRKGLVYLDDIQAAQLAAVTVQTGDVLLNITGASIGRVSIAPSDLAGARVNQHVCIIRPNDAIDSRFLSAYLSAPNIQDLIASDNFGVTRQALTKQQILDFTVPVPPLAEQTRIADQLDTLLARVNACNDHLDAIPGILKRFRQAVLNAATSGSLTEDWRSSDIASWRRVLLSEVAKDFSYGSASKSASSGQVPVLRMGNIQGGRLDWTDLVYTSDSSEIEKYKLTKGDVLFNRTNSPELVGKTAVFQGEREAIYAGYLIRVRCTSDLLPEYLNYCLGSKAGRDYCWSVKSDGVSQSNINAKKLAAFPFSLPTLDEQREIVRRVEALFAQIDRIEARYTAMRAHAQRLAPQALAKAFRGELVEQDPKDEPASVLLQRLAATASAKAPSSRGRPRAQPEVPATLPAPQAPAPIDWHTLPNNEWAAPATAQDQAITVCLTAVLKAWSQPMPELEARLATLLCQQPRVFTTVLPAAQAKQWMRLVGDEAKPLPAQVARLQPVSNSPWGQAIKRMRARGDLVEAGSADDTTWSLGPGASAIITAGWPDGRAAFVVAHLRAHGVASILPTLAPADQAFVHVRAA